LKDIKSPVGKAFEIIGYEIMQYQKRRGIILLAQNFGNVFWTGLSGTTVGVTGGADLHGYTLIMARNFANRADFSGAIAPSARLWVRRFPFVTEKPYQTY
jgi:hypothetical protein